MASTTELLQTKFKELTTQRETILASSAPLRAQRDTLAEQKHAIESQMDNLADQVRAAEDGLYEIDNERGAISKALSGKTG